MNVTECSTFHGRGQLTVKKKEREKKVKRNYEGSSVLIKVFFMAAISVPCHAVTSSADAHNKRFVNVSIAAHVIKKKKCSFLSL